MRAKAEKKVQIAIDKMMDLMCMVEQSEQIQRILDKLNDLEASVRNGEFKNGKIKLR